MTLHEKLTALEGKWGAEACGEPNFGRAQAFRDCITDLRDALASASTPEETPPDVEALVLRFGDAAIEYGGAERANEEGAFERVKAARSALLSAIGSSVSAAREEGARIALRFKAGWSPDHAREMGRIVANSLSPTKDQE